MKKNCLCQILTVVSMILMALPVVAQDVFYVYRNDRCINTFFTEDIDSIVYSNFDTDSVWHDDVVTQVIYEADTLYRIPLEVIDSVGFRTPPTEYRQGTIVLEGEIRKYILSRDSLTLVFDNMTPNELLPKVGDHLVSTIGDDVMPSAFIGKVNTISPQANGIIVDCSVCSLSDVFVRYFGVSRGEPAAQDSPRKEIGDEDWPKPIYISPGKLSHDLYNSHGLGVSFFPVDFLSFNRNDYRVTCSFTPDLQVRGYFLYDRNYDVNLGVKITGTCDFSQDMRFAGSISLQKDQRLWQHSWPIPDALIDITAEIGVFLQAEVELAIQRKMEQRYELDFHWEWSSSGHNMLKNGFVLRPVSHSEEGGTTIKGDLHGGGYGQVGVAFIATDNLDIAEINLRIEGGVGIKGESTFTPENILNRMNSTVLYNELKDKEIETYWFYGTKVECKLFKWGLNYDIPNFFNIPFGKHGRMDSRFAVPFFSDTKLNRRGKSKLLAQTNASRRTYREDIGFMLTNKDNQSDTTPIYLIQGYTGPSSQLEYMFANLNGEKYKVDPLVKLMGVEMLAEPSSDAILDLPVKITDFKQTGSHYQKDGYTHDGRTYDYKYDVAVTVELTDDEGVADWGYVYKDPYGNIAHISLKKYGSPYTDTNYVYYRNESKSTVTLYEFVKYEGEEDYVYGEPKDYEVSHSLTYCPDDHHPHMIDLGLPSGTKWACCNVGASTPEGYGGYYAWGETQEKGVYNWETYQYGSFWDNCQNLGSDIAGTSYDVAHVQWGDPWMMPSLTQIQELLSNCTYQWTKKNGVGGGLFTGPSGGTIFLPAAGFQGNRGLENARSSGYSWSSTPHRSNSYDAYGLKFHSSDAQWSWGDYYYRFYGHTVRPVSR